MLVHGQRRATERTELPGGVGVKVRKDPAYCSVGGPESALRYARISRNGRGSQQVRPREVTLRSPNPPSVGMGCKVACPGVKDGVRTLP